MLQSLSLRRLLFLTVASLLLSACASQSTAPGGSQSAEGKTAKIEAPKPVPKAPEVATDWDNYQQVLRTIDQWQVQGKLGVRLPDNSGSVYFNWKQRPSDFAIHLNGPLGQGTTWIRGNDRRVSLEQSGEPPVFAATPEELMLKSLGWWLPISELYYWVRGIPAPGSNPDQLTRGQDGTLLELQQNGWQLEFSRYKIIKGWSLPSKVIARRDDIKLTFIIKNWKLH